MRITTIMLLMALFIQFTGFIYTADYLSEQNENLAKTIRNVAEKSYFVGCQDMNLIGFNSQICKDLSKEYAKGIPQ